MGTAAVMIVTIPQDDPNGNNWLLTPRTTPTCLLAEKTFRIKQFYDIQQVLGEGAYGVVFQALRKKDGLPVALKTMSRKQTDIAEFQREVSALKRLTNYRGGHPHVCQLYDLHSDEKRYYLAMELIQGGELLDHLIRQGPYSERQAAGFLRQFAEGIRFVHDAGYTHADLKLENLLLSSLDDKQAQIKVVDFGCALRTEEEGDGTEEKRVFGTVAYWPPELYKKKFRPSPAMDMWAAGCIVYILVTGTHPFDKYATASDAEIAKTVQRVGKKKDLMSTLVFDERTKNLSSSCVDLIRRLMHPDPSKRMTSEEFRRHPWVQGLTASWDALEESHRKLEAFWQKRFRDEIVNEFAEIIDSSSGSGELSDRDMAAMFQAMDLDGNGTLELEEIQAFFQRHGFKDEMISEIFRCADLDDTGLISFDEFRTLMRKRFDDGPDLRLKHHQQRFRTNILKKFGSASAKQRKPLAGDKNLRKMFDDIDLDGNGVLDAHEIRLVLRGIGEKDEEVISQIVASIDLNHDGEVSWEEFQEIMSLDG